MEGNKYYTPSIDEFYIGFEYEALNSNDWYFSESETGWKKMRWEPRLGSLNQGIINVDNAIQKFWIKVKYLDREDIEAEGFRFLYEDDGRLIFKRKTEQRFKSVDMLFNPKNNWVLIWHGGNFAGTVKNRSEFKKVLKMIGI